MSSDPFLTITLDINPVALSVGWLSVRWYGLAYVVAIAVGVWCIRPYAARRGFSGDQFDGVVLACMAAGFIGGRLYYVIQNDPASYLTEPWRVAAVWEGGMAFFGAILAVSCALVVLARMNRWPTGSLLRHSCLLCSRGPTHWPSWQCRKRGHSRAPNRRSMGRHLFTS